MLKPVHIVTDILFTSKAPKVEAILRGGFETIFIQVELSDNPNDTPFNGVYLSQEGNKFSCNGVWLG